MVKSTTTRIINVEQAELKTATVEIRNITVNTRKMTLSVFRQIPEENIITKNVNKFFSLNGVPWGLVNYYWGDMSEQQLHVLWQKGKELRRSLNYHGVKLIGDSFFEKWSDIDCLAYFYGDSPYIDIRGSAHCIRACDSRGELSGRYCKKFNKDHIDISEIVKKYNHRIGEEAKVKMLEEALQGRLNEIHEWKKSVICFENERRENYNSLVEALAELSQLFIAV